MKDKHYLWMFIFSLAGFLFSGYLTFSKIIIGSCPLAEGCPVFMGYPACYYGFVIFTALIILTSMLLFKNKAKMLKPIMYVSLLGVLFSAFSTYTEYSNPSCLGGVCNYSLYFPTCVYGLVMYALIFVISILKSKK